MNPIWTRRIFMSVASTLAAVAVSRPAAADSETGASQPAGLTDVDWRVVEVAGNAVEGENPVTLKLGADGTFSGRACNSFGGSYKLDGGALSFGQATSTMMACEEPLMSQERALFDAFEKTTGYDLSDDGNLTLRDENGAALVVAQN